MKRLFATVVVFSAAAVFAQAQAPAIKAGGVVNSASYAAAGLPNGPVAQGSLFVVFGSRLGPATLQQATSYPLATTLGGTSLSLTIGGTTTKPPIIYTSAGQLAAILPSTTPVGTGTLTVTYNGQTSATAPIQVVASSFGIYSLNQGGSGLGVITNANFQLVSSTNSANPGEAFIIFGTGVGPAAGDETGPGSGLKLGTIPVEVLVGGKSANVYGYARAPQFSGEDQIAFAIPAGVTGCSVPVAVKIGNVVSNYVTMPIAASGRTCSDPAGLGGPVTVTQSGVVSTGSVNLSRASVSITAAGVTVNGTTDSASGSFNRYQYSDYIAASSPFQLSTYGSCTVFTFQGTAATAPTTPSPVVLDAGPSLTLNGPGGAKTLTKMSGYYSATLGGGLSFPGGPAVAPLYLARGTYTISGPGGADVGPFTATLNVPDPLNWTNSGNINNVNRASGQLITWTGGDPAGQTYIFGYSITGTNDTNAVGSEFVCVENTSVGQFTIPSVVLLSLPATSSNLTSGGSLAVESSNQALFKASGLDQGAFTNTSVSLKLVNFQ